MSAEVLAAAQEIRPARGSQNPTALDRHYEILASSGESVGTAGFLENMDGLAMALISPTVSTDSKVLLTC